MVLGRTHEKFGQTMAQGQGHDELRRRQARADGAQPGTELLPDHVWTEQGQGLKQTLGDEAQLQVGVVGPDFAADLISIACGLAVEILVASPARPWGHGAHPEMIRIGAQGVDGLLETDLDFETEAEHFDDLQTAQG